MRGYPRTRFDIVDQTSVNTITTTANGNTSNIALYMQAYTSDKGSEDWELLYGFDGFTERKGGISFVKHGQAQLFVANALANGAAILAKRVVSENATLANTTVRAKLVVANGVGYLYTYKTSTDEVVTFEDACEAGYDNYDSSADSTNVDGVVTYDVPLFTVAAVGRGVSLLYFKLTPDYTMSKSNQFTRYLFEITEKSSTLESFACSMNTECIVNGSNYSLETKVKSSNQVKLKMYEDAISKLLYVMTNIINANQDTTITVSELAGVDWLNGLDVRGANALNNIVTKSVYNSEGTETNNYTTYKPDGIDLINIGDEIGISLDNGSYGTMGSIPMENPTEYEKIMKYAYGAIPEPHTVYDVTDSMLYDPVIYDVDRYKIDAIFDCNFPLSVKKAIIDICDFRGDCVFFCDMGTTENTLQGIIEKSATIPESKYVALYHNYFKITNPFDKKECTVTLPYLLGVKMISHITNGVIRPFAGIINNMYFSEIITSSINFIPVQIPGLDQKQYLVDNNINYISLYNMTPILETTYINKEEYSQLSFLNNIMGVQEIIKAIRERCPYIRYTFLDGSDLEDYMNDINDILTNYQSNFDSIEATYAGDEDYEKNKIFYAVLKVKFKDFVQEEYFKINAIDTEE